MVLLEILHRLREEWGWRLVVAHFNHRLRGRASDADEAFVKKEAARRGLRCVAGRGDVRAFARRHGVSIEMAARQLRHTFLAKSARRRCIPTVALAHHADDQVELFFLRLFRGAGGRGLAGMPPASASPVDAGIRLVRPLLTVTRDELAAYARQQALRFREDASNACLDFLRNKVRRRLVPLIEREFQPAIRRTVLRAVEILGSETDFVRESADEWLAARPRAPWAGLPPAVQRQVLQRQLLGLEVAPEFELIEQLRQRPDHAVCVGSGLALVRDEHGTVRGLDPCAPSFNPAELAVQLGGVRGRFGFAGLWVNWRREPGRGLAGLRRLHPGCEFFDAERVGEGIVLRCWRAGDRFQPIGMPVAVKLQDLFVNAGVPRGERHRRVVATASSGEVFWVEGLRIGDGFKLDKGTTRRLKWQWRRGGTAVAPARGA